MSAAIQSAVPCRRLTDEMCPRTQRMVALSRAHGPSVLSRTQGNGASEAARDAATEAMQYATTTAQATSFKDMDAITLISTCDYDFHDRLIEFFHGKVLQLYLVQAG